MEHRDSGTVLSPHPDHHTGLTGTPASEGRTEPADEHWLLLQRVRQGLIDLQWPEEDPDSGSAPRETVALAPIELTDRRAYIPSELDSADVQSAVAATFPELQQRHTTTGGLRMHTYHNPASGSWAVAIEDPSRAQHGHIREHGQPLWDDVIAVVTGWKAVRHPQP